MSFKNQHSGRVTNPGQYTSFARKNIASGVDIILGIKEGKSTAQAYRFNKSKFTAQEAREWLKSHDVKTIKFEPAKDDSKKSIPGEPHSPYAGIQDPAAQYITPEEAKAKISQNSTQNVINIRKLIDPDYGVQAGAISIEHGAKPSGKIKKKGNDMQDEGKATLKLCDFCGGDGECHYCGGKGIYGSGEDCDECSGTGYCPDCDGDGFLNSEKEDGIDLHFTHYDSIPMTPEFMTESFKRTPEGYLKGRPVVTNVGVFSYKGPKGEIIRELRLPEEVFSDESLETLKLKPVTNGHPKEKVNSENIKKYGIGSLGNNPSKRPVFPDGSPILYSNGGNIKEYSDGFRLSIDMIITENNAIQAVNEGKRALSCGYECDSIMAEPGTKWMGMEYDYVQKNIRYNHVAIVDVARAGDDAVIRLDSADPEGLVYINNDHKEVNMAELKKFIIDGEEYQADPEFIKAFRQEKIRADKAEKSAEEEKTTSKKAVTEKEAAQKDGDKMKAEIDSYKDEIKKLKDEIATLKAKKGDSAEILAAVKTRTALVEVAKKVGAEFKDDMSDSDIKRVVILKLYPSADLKDKTDEYLQARFDSAVELSAIDADMISRRVGHSDSGMSFVKEEKSKTPFAEANKARDDFMERTFNESRGITPPAVQ